ncbi:MAG: DUF2249 domain-containing protein [Deltaproteobacteria bacterium]|nr:DUF2249 domain-containing protein [Deltaproteobacteria bacterium]
MTLTTATHAGRPDAGERLDVRETPAKHKHPTIFGRYNALLAGECFTLVNDHDPRPLHYQFLAEYSGRFEWEYLESGPEVWRVRIGKPRAS